jgi:hypothetical protein
MELTDGEEPICAACGERGRLLCAGCGRTFCPDHVERHFAMGYFYLCAECEALRQEPPPPARRPRGKTPKA